jgi:hypothetical protein
LGTREYGGIDRVLYQFMEIDTLEGRVRDRHQTILFFDIRSYAPSLKP